MALKKQENYNILHDTYYIIDDTDSTSDNASTAGVGGNGIVKIGVRIIDDEKDIQKRKQFAIKLLVSRNTRGDPKLTVIQNYVIQDILLDAGKREFGIAKECYEKDGHVIEPIAVLEYSKYQKANGKIETINAIVTEYLKFGDLLYQGFPNKSDFDDKMCRTLFIQLLNGIKQIHAKNYVHLDLKGDNLMLNEKAKLKIIDFGHAAVFTQNTKMTHYNIGTPLFLSPEVHAKTPYDGILQDLYQAGIILFKWYSGHYPFENQFAISKKTLFDQFHEDNNNFWLGLNINSLNAQRNKNSHNPEYKDNPSFKKLINKLLAKEPTQRHQSVDSVLNDEWCSQQYEKYTENEMRTKFEKSFKAYKYLEKKQIGYEIEQLFGQSEHLGAQKTQNYSFTKEMLIDFKLQNIGNKRRVKEQILPLRCFDLKIQLCIWKTWELVLSTLYGMKQQNLISELVPSENQYKVWAFDEQRHVQFYVSCRQMKNNEADVQKNNEADVPNSAIIFKRKSGDSISFYQIIKEISREIEANYYR